MLGGPQRASGPARLGAPTTAPGLPRKKVPLAPGHSPLDWAKLKSSGKDLRGVSRPGRLTLEDLAAHNTREDVWMAIQGRVYNVTHYSPFHPGGVGQVMRGAGKDATEMFLKIHPWVNVEMMLDECFVGFLVRERPDGV
ncbi:cytochrome b5-like heme/steroid binding domain-containing protein [Blyttiomyces helicus]|uniref:Cytochrome b5-like heme/steroid binding domain-containing protein n=1 Tax=Blyttiomyces helicus TaxID=388810 RepID=A0A4P9VZ40_9FUNG|nr:cytochrome b5-like heme/steroid binding domain-containing protein [Blyttiomyces helicus]|eukprot:RKO84043.1 cytochrome b5-like heme/steroid binding domain-containing protein [Blyttiomyces helicus]